MLTKPNPAFAIEHENPADANAVEQLILQVFGPGMFARAAHCLRDGVAAEAELSFVARLNDMIIGSVRLTRFTIGDRVALLLGPLGVLDAHKNLGVGRALMRAAIAAAGDKRVADGPEMVLLVGDLAYYKPFGFKRVPDGQILLPRPVDPNRILVCELVDGALNTHSGVAHGLNA